MLQFILAVYLYQSFGLKASRKRTKQEAAPEPAHGEQNYAYVDPEYEDLDPDNPARYHDDLHQTVPPHVAYHHGDQM